MKAFIISLSKVPSSFESSKKVLSSLLNYGIDAELFEGTYGNEAKEKFNIDNRRIARYGIKTEILPVDVFREKFPNEPIPSNVISMSVRSELDPNTKIAKILRPGVIGCFYSHYRLWKKCVELNEPIMIFEDDVIFERTFIPVKWDEVLLLCTGKEAYKHNFFAPKLYNPEGEPCAIELPNTSMPGAVGYAIKPVAAKKLVDYYREEFLPADTAMNVFVVKLECHNYLMGRAAIAEDGKVSLTSSNCWDSEK